VKPSCRQSATALRYSFCCNSITYVAYLAVFVEPCKHGFCVLGILDFTTIDSPQHSSPWHSPWQSRTSLSRLLTSSHSSLDRSQLQVRLISRLLTPCNIRNAHAAALPRASVRVLRPYFRLSRLAFATRLFLQNDACNLVHALSAFAH
jgi:hypothetical protein